MEHYLDNRREMLKTNKKTQVRMLGFFDNIR